MVSVLSPRTIHPERSHFQTRNFVFESPNHIMTSCGKFYSPILKQPPKGEMVRSNSSPIKVRKPGKMIEQRARSTEMKVINDGRRSNSFKLPATKMSDKAVHHGSKAFGINIIPSYPFIPSRCFQIKLPTTLIPCTSFSAGSVSSIHFLRRFKKSCLLGQQYFYQLFFRQIQRQIQMHTK